MSIFDETLEEREKKVTSQFIKTDEIQTGVWIVKKVDIIKANNLKYGANDTDALFKRGILLEGETIRYTFEDDESNEKYYESKGAAFYYGFRAEELKAGTPITISKEGQGESTRYTVAVVGKK